MNDTPHSLTLSPLQRARCAAALLQAQAGLLNAIAEEPCRVKRRLLTRTVKELDVWRQLLIDDAP